MSAFFDIDAGLNKRLTEVPSRPTNANIAWENIKYDPILGTRWWRPTNMPAESEVSDFSMLQKHQGIYQVDVFQPTTSKGTAALLRDLDNIYATFNTVLSIHEGDSRIDILGISKGRIVREDNWCHGFIKINYVCYSH